MRARAWFAVAVGVERFRLTDRLALRRGGLRRGAGSARGLAALRAVPPPLFRLCFSRSARSMTCAERGRSSSPRGFVISLVSPCLDLLPDPRHQVVVVRVLVLRRIPAFGHVVDQPLRELDLLRRHACRSSGPPAAARGRSASPQLVLVAQRDRASARAHAAPRRRGAASCGSRPARPRRGASPSASRAAAHRPSGRRAAGREVVRRFEVLERGSRRRRRTRGCRSSAWPYVGAAEILVGQHDVLVLFVLVALDDVSPTATSLPVVLL